MKIRELIQILESAPDKDALVSIPSTNNSTTQNIDYDFDDLGDIELYEVSGNFVN